MSSINERSKNTYNILQFAPLPRNAPGTDHAQVNARIHGAVAQERLPEWGFRMVLPGADVLGYFGGDLVRPAGNFGRAAE